MNMDVILREHDVKCFAKIKKSMWFLYLSTINQYPGVLKQVKTVIATYQRQTQTSMKSAKWIASKTQNVVDLL